MNKKRTDIQENIHRFYLVDHLVYQLNASYFTIFEHARSQKRCSSFLFLRSLLASIRFVKKSSFESAALFATSINQSFVSSLARL